jgi:hypothetical protein
MRCDFKMDGRPLVAWQVLLNDRTSQEGNQQESEKAHNQPDYGGGALQKNGFHRPGSLEIIGSEGVDL